MSEQWRQIPDFRNYWVSNRGRIVNLRLKRLILGSLNNKGLETVHLSIRNKRYVRSVEKLRREAFGENNEY